MATIQHLTGAQFRALFSSPLRRVGRTIKRGEELQGPCPFCGGRDRFVVWPDIGQWTCRHCKGFTPHSDIDFILDRDHGGISRESEGFKEAFKATLQTLGIQSTTTTTTPTAEDPTPQSCEPPNADWQARADSFWWYCFDQLWSLDADELPLHPQAIEYLVLRGLNEETAQWAEIGYNPKTIYDTGERWGLELEEGQRVWLPAGLVFPWRVGGAMWKLCIRQFDGDTRRYITVKGSTNPPYQIDTVLPNHPLIMVEGPFDALAVHQAMRTAHICGDKVGCVATGTTQGRNIRWIAQMSRASTILLAHDDEESGDKAADYWQDIYRDKAKRLRPTRKDPGDMLREGDDIAAWIGAAL